MSKEDKKTTEDKRKIADMHRDALRQFMREKNLNMLSWAKKADIPESTLRNFLNEESESMTAYTLFRLAKSENASISEILGESSFIKTELLARIIDLSHKKSKELGLSSTKEAEAISYLYEIACSEGKGKISEEALEKEVTSILRFTKRQQNQD